MPAALFDANAISDLMRDHPMIVSRVARHSDSITTSAVAVGEIRYGLERLPAGKRKTDLELRARMIIDAMQVEPITEQIAQIYGITKAMAESRGLNLANNDLWIAATAMTAGSVLVTRDGALTQIPGLQVENWTL